jgi:hypothetical protein
MKTIIKMTFYLELDTEVSDRQKVSNVIRKEWIPSLSKRIEGFIARDAFATNKERQTIIDQIGNFTATIDTEVPGQPKKPVNVD